MLTDLLDELCKKANCVYMSDLSQNKCKKAVSAAAKELMLLDFDGGQWIAAAQYVSLGKVKAKTAKDAKEYFNNL